MKRLALAAVLLVASLAAALAQQTVTRIGPITPGDCASFSSPNSIQDGGIPCPGAGGTLALPNGTTATTQSPFSDNTTKVATDAFVQGAISLNSTHFAAGGTSTGSANAQVIATTSPPVFSLTGNPTVTFNAGFSNTGATTLNVVSTGVINVLKKTSAGLVALVTGDIIAGQQYLATYDGTQYELQTPSQAPPPSSSTLGGVQSLTCSTSNWFRTLSTGGVFGCSQPGAPDISFTQTGTGTVARTVQVKLGEVLSAKDFGAVCDGVTDDAVALQNWANALRDGGTGAAPSTLGCATSAPITFMPSTNTGPTQGPHVIGNLKLVGLSGLGAAFTGTGSGTNLTASAITGAIHVGDFVTGTGVPASTFIISQTSGPSGGAGVYVTNNATTSSGASLSATSDILRIWNPTASAATQNFYYPTIDSLELSSTSGIQNCLSVRGFWGHIDRVYGTGCAGDVLQFPNFTFGGIPDEYESSPRFELVSGIGAAGFVVNNQIGIGATPYFGNIRGTVVSSITTGAGAANFSGSEKIAGQLAYTGTGWAITVDKQGIASTPHELTFYGSGDIDCAQNGVNLVSANVLNLTIPRMNVEPPVTCNASSWPLTAYSFGSGGGGSKVLTDAVVNAYITIRPGVTAANIGTLFNFTNEFNIARLTLNAVISDQSGANVLGTLGFAGIYKNINANATIKIIQNGVVVYDNTGVFTFANLPTCNAGMQGVSYGVSDSNTVVFNAAIAGGGANKIKGYCNGTSWVVGG